MHAVLAEPLLAVLDARDARGARVAAAAADSRRCGAPFLTAAGKQVGDRIVLTAEGANVPVTIVGEAFNTDSDGLQVVTDVATLGAVRPSTYYVSVKPGVNVEAYTRSLTTALDSVGAVADRLGHEPDEMLIIVNLLTGLLSLMLIVVGLGVMNTVVLETRERMHDIGVHKHWG